jgi:hypothetical protein
MLTKSKQTKRTNKKKKQVVDNIVVTVESRWMPILQISDEGIKWYDKDGKLIEKESK